jgi:hypothetical protein
MVRPSEDDREAVDRAFAEMVAAYHLTADRPERPADQAMPAPAPSTDASSVEAGGVEGSVVEGSVVEGSVVDSSWADAHPLFRFVESPTPPEPSATLDEEAAEPYEPDPLPPLRRPGIPALVGWIGMAYAVVVVLAGTFGVTFPVWAGWLGVCGFIGGFGILMTRLPRDRPPGAGNGAVV